MSKVLLFSLLFFVTVSFGDGFEIPSPNNYRINYTHIAEDFDGDGIKEIRVELVDDLNNQTALYSFSKKQYLIILDNADQFQFADLDGEPGMELLTNHKIYKYGESGTGSTVK